ncbi:MAG: hypothetical protein ABSH19_06490 [Opitutales bacterium]|jgi:hypothetical protein
MKTLLCCIHSLTTQFARQANHARFGPLSIAARICLGISTLIAACGPLPALQTLYQNTTNGQLVNSSGTAPANLTLASNLTTSANTTLAIGANASLFAATNSTVDLGNATLILPSGVGGNFSGGSGLPAISGNNGVLATNGTVLGWNGALTFTGADAAFSGNVTTTGNISGTFNGTLAPGVNLPAAQLTGNVANTFNGTLAPSVSLPATQLTGNIPVSQFNGGVNANASTVFWGNGTWSTAPTGGSGGGNGTVSVGNLTGLTGNGVIAVNSGVAGGNGDLSFNGTTTILAGNATIANGVLDANVATNLGQWITVADSNGGNISYFPQTGFRTLNSQGYATALDIAGVFGAGIGRLYFNGSTEFDFRLDADSEPYVFKLGHTSEVTPLIVNPTNITVANDVIASGNLVASGNLEGTFNGTFAGPAGNLSVTNYDGGISANSSTVLWGNGTWSPVSASVGNATNLTISNNLTVGNTLSIANFSLQTPGANGLTFSGNTSGNPVTIQATGTSDADVGISILPKGANGTVAIGPTQILPSLITYHDGAAYPGSPITPVDDLLQNRDPANGWAGGSYFSWSDDSATLPNATFSYIEGGKVNGNYTTPSVAGLYNNQIVFEIANVNNVATSGSTPDLQVATLNDFRTISDGIGGNTDGDTDWVFSHGGVLNQPSPDVIFNSGEEWMEHPLTVANSLTLSGAGANLSISGNSSAIISITSNGTSQGNGYFPVYIQGGNPNNNYGAEINDTVSNTNAGLTVTNGGDGTHEVTFGYGNTAEHTAIYQNGYIATPNSLVFLTGGNIAFSTGPLSGNIFAQFNQSGQFSIGTVAPVAGSNLTVEGSATVTGVLTASGGISVNATNGAGSSTGTLTNAPGSGNPVMWIPITVNGTVYHVPAW